MLRWTTLCLILRMPDGVLLALDGAHEGLMFTVDRIDTFAAYALPQTQDDEGETEGWPSGTGQREAKQGVVLLPGAIVKGQREGASAYLAVSALARENDILARLIRLRFPWAVGVAAASLPPAEARGAFCMR